MPVRDAKLDQLQRVPLFAGLSKKELRLVAGHTEEVVVQAGKVLCREGESANEFGLIISGGAEVTRAGRRLAKLGPGEFYGEMAILDASPRSATVTATTACELIVMHRRDFSLLIDSVPGIARKVLAGLASRLREADRKLIG
jgi:CRP/FNR family cyclic AMP-dependent transcriptional regulator